MIRAQVTIDCGRRPSISTATFKSRHLIDVKKNKGVGRQDVTVNLFLLMENNERTTVDTTTIRILVQNVHHLQML